MLNKIVSFGLVFSAITLASQAQSQHLVDNGIFMLFNEHAKKCLDVKDHSTADGATLQQWDCKNEPQQKFRAEHIGYGLWQFKSILSGKCIQFKPGQENANGARAVIGSDCSGYSRAFVPDIVGQDNEDNPFYRFKTTASSSLKCLDIAGPSTASGAPLQQWSCSTGLNQKWFVIQTLPTTPGSQYNIIHAKSGRCLDVKDHSLVEGAPLQLWQCVNKPHQAFYFRNVEETHANIEMVESHLYLSENGVRAVQSENGTLPHIQAVDNKQGVYTVRKYADVGENCLTVDGAAANGVKIAWKTCAPGNEAQEWSFKANGLKE